MPSGGNGKGLVQDASIQALNTALGAGPPPQGGNGRGLAQDASVQVTITAVATLAASLVALSSAAPQAVATAASAGVATTASRSDHAHALPFTPVQSALNAATGAVSVNSQKVTNLATPTNPTDAATKAYADSLATGLNLKANVNALAATTIVLSGTQTIDGVALVAGNRVLAAGQGGNLTTPAVTNGIYVVAAGAWALAADFPAASHAQGVFTFVSQGTTYADTGFVCITDSPNDVVGVNALQFAQFSAGQAISAGNGIAINGGVVSVTAAVDGSIAVGAGGVGVGVLASDAQHGIRGGGTLHANVVNAGAAGFMSGADKTKLDAIAGNGTLLLTQGITLAQLQAAGAVGSATFNVGAVLPANARLVNPTGEIIVTQGFSATGLAAAVASLQSTADSSGSLGAAIPILAAGSHGAVGATNPYFSRAGQQLTVTVTLTGAVLNTLTAGAITVNFLYTTL